MWMIKGKEDLVQTLEESSARKAMRVFLATDPDREGEAISWHLGLSAWDWIWIRPTASHFNEITKSGVQGGYGIAASELIWIW